MQGPCYTCRAASVLQSAAIVGLDCEWRPHWQAGKGPNPVQTLQASAIYLTTYTDMCCCCRDAIGRKSSLLFCIAANTENIAAVVQLIFTLGLTDCNRRGGFHTRPPRCRASAGLQQLRGLLASGAVEGWRRTQGGPHTPLQVLHCIVRKHCLSRASKRSGNDKSHNCCIPL